VSAGGTTEVASNDDNCGGNGSLVSYKATATGYYTIHAGCFSSGSCSGTVAVKVKPALWTPWFDRDDPSGNGDGEYLSALIAEGKSICASPLTAQCRRISDQKDWKETGEVVSCSPNLGAVCENAKQADGACDDYEVRFACASEGAYSAWIDRDDPSGTGDGEALSILRESPFGVCDQPIGAECRRKSDGKDWTLLGEKVSCTASGGSICTNNQQPDGSCFDYEVRMVCPANGAWTSNWGSLDSETGNGDGEHLGQHIATFGVCAQPLGIQCRRVSDKVDWTATGDKMVCSPTQGSICLNADQSDGRCDNYEVRFYCAEGAQ
jgi:hypothetical protein